eukprot:scaffold2208_cov170-Ochromonas_danica.AAC.2
MFSELSSDGVDLAWVVKSCDDVDVWTLQHAILIMNKGFHTKKVVGRGPFEGPQPQQIVHENFYENFKDDFDDSDLE